MITAMADVFDRVSVVAYDPPDGASSEEHAVGSTVDASNVGFVSLGPMGTWRDAWSRSRRARSVVTSASSGWDVLILWLMNRRIGVVRNSSSCPRVVSIDGSCITDEARTSRTSLLRGVAWRALTEITESIGRRTIRASGLVVVNSTMLAERHQALNGNIVVRRWSRRPSGLAYRRDDRLTGQTPPRFLIAGRLSPYKGVFEALEAFAKIKQHILPDATLVVAGEGESLAELKDRAAALGVSSAVSFHGWIPGDKLFALYEETDVLLHVSYAESFPRIVAEALAHSVLVVCTRVGGLADLLDDEREVLFVPVGSADAIVDAVRRLVEDGDLRRGLIERGFVAAEDSAVDVFVRRVVDDVRRTWPDLDHRRQVMPAPDGT